MARYDWSQSQRGLVNDFQLQAYGGDAAPLNSSAQHTVQEVEFSEIDLGLEPNRPADAKVREVAGLAVLLMHPLWTVRNPLTQAKVRLTQESVQPKAVKAPLRTSGDVLAAPGFSSEGEVCRTVFVRTDGPVPAKVRLYSSAACSSATSCSSFTQTCRRLWLCAWE